MNAHRKYRTIKRSTLRLIIATLAGLMLLSSTACDDSNLVVTHNNEQADNTNDEQDDPSVDPNDEALIDEHGHGTSDEENVVVEPGFMNGSWRAGSGDQDQPAVYFDTFHDAESSDISGDYTMGFAIYELYDGEAGELESATFDGETLTILWNPTTDRDEMLTLKATQVDENTLEGAVTAKRNIELNIPITLTRNTTD